VRKHRLHFEPDEGSTKIRAGKVTSGRTMYHSTCRRVVSYADQALLSLLRNCMGIRLSRKALSCVSSLTSAGEATHIRFE